MCCIRSCTLLRSWDWNIPCEFAAWFLNLKWCGTRGFRNTFHNTEGANSGKSSYRVTLDTTVLMSSCGVVSIFISSNKCHLWRLHLFEQSLLLNVLSSGVPHFTQYFYPYPVSSLSIVTSEAIPGYQVMLRLILLQIFIETPLMSCPPLCDSQF